MRSRPLTRAAFDTRPRETALKKSLNATRGVSDRIALLLIRLIKQVVDTVGEKTGVGLKGTDGRDRRA